MSMQSLLVSNNYASLKEALFCAGTYETALARALWQFCDAVFRSRAAVRRELRELPELRRGVPSQQYPMFGAAWPYIRRRHWHYRKQKQRDYHSTHIYGKGTIYWKNDGVFLEYAVHDYDKYSLRADSDRHPCESAYEKRIAKRINNKRRRADGKREIAREMDLWAREAQQDQRIYCEEVAATISASGGYWGAPCGAGNVYVPPDPECFGDGPLAGVVADMARLSPTTYSFGRWSTVCTVSIGRTTVTCDGYPELNPSNFNDYTFFDKD